MKNGKCEPHSFGTFWLLFGENTLNWPFSQCVFLYPICLIFTKPKSKNRVAYKKLFAEYRSGFDDSWKKLICHYADEADHFRGKLLLPKGVRDLGFFGILVEILKDFLGVIWVFGFFSTKCTGFFQSYLPLAMFLIFRRFEPLCIFVLKFFLINIENTSENTW